MKAFRKIQLTALCALPLLAGCGGTGTAPAESLPLAADADSIAEGVSTLSRDGATLAWIQDNGQERLMERSLFPSASDSLIDALGLADGVPSSVSTFVLRTDSATVLFDTGLGAPDSRLLRGLQALGLRPADVDYLFLTHFHGDHIGGMMQGDSVTFPRAQVYASRVEYEAWMNMPAEQKALAERTMQAYADRLHLFEFGDTLPCGVATFDASGHTPGHTVYRTGPFLVAGDLMHGAALQLSHPEVSATYDMDPEKAAATRRHFLKYAQDDGLVLAGMHLPRPAFLDFGAPAGH